MGKELLSFTFKGKKYQLRKDCIYQFMYADEQGKKYGVPSTKDNEYIYFNVDDSTMALTLSFVAHCLDNELILKVLSVSEDYIICNGKEKILIEVGDNKFYFQSRGSSKNTIFDFKALCERIRFYNVDNMPYKVYLVCESGHTVALKTYELLKLTTLCKFIAKK